MTSRRKRRRLNRAGWWFCSDCQEWHKHSKGPYTKLTDYHPCERVPNLYVETVFTSGVSGLVEYTFTAGGEKL